MEEETTKLYGHTIVFSKRRTLTDQVYDILCEEIHRGRWRVGEKTPSHTELAEQGGLSRMPIQQAFERLEQEGYVRSKERVGSFLISAMPKGLSPKGSIGILMMAHESNVTAGRALTWHARVHLILQAAVERGYQIETVYLTRSDDWSKVDRKGRYFSDRTRGIISLHLFPRASGQQLDSDQIPFVFWGAPTDQHFPCVYGDHVLGMRMLTQRVIEKGHRDIAFFPSPQYDTALRAQSYVQSYARTMKEAGLSIDHEVLERFRAIHEDDFRATKEALESLDRTTAIICDGAARLRGLVSVFDIMGVRAPKDLSLVGPRTNLRQHNPKEFATGIAYPQEELVKACFDSLSVQMATGRSPTSRTLIRPIIREAESLGPPTRSPFFAANNAARAEVASPAAGK
jgi:GntR family transcriptional regulator of arabinose operon